MAEKEGLLALRARPFGAAALRATFCAASPLVEPAILISRVRIPFDNKNKAPQRGALVFGGEGGIRTLETFPFTHFPGVRLRPLGHLSRSDAQG